MKFFKSCTIGLGLAVAVGMIAGADEKITRDGDAAHLAFEKIKALSGDWEVTPGAGEHEHGPMGDTVSYKVTAGGSAVLETLFGGTEHEMVTLYYIEGDNLALTHYCMLQNRPHMRAEPQTSPEKIVFKCQDGENAKIESETHMHQVTFTFGDADHLKSDWVLFKAGKADSTHAFELSRKKK